MKTHGDTGWEKFPSYFDVFIPPFLDLLDELNLRITFFIVGQDAALEKNADALREVTRRGHEVGNHSFYHEPWLHLYSKEQIKTEIYKAEEHINKATGQRPLGFRGPGFSYSKELFEVLVDNHYMYDASTFPTYLGPLARLYYFWTSHLTEAEKNQRDELFGRFKDGLRPVKPYFLGLPSGDLFLELPVTTIPVFKMPFHLSYLIYISRFSRLLMSFYLNAAIMLCRMTGTRPSFLLHPLDFLDRSLVPELSFFPGMDMDKERKIDIFIRVLEGIASHFELANMSSFAKDVIKEKSLEVVCVY